MIDTSRYEGHTPAPWTWRGETIDGDGEVNHTVCYMEHPHVNGEMNEVDARLIADTPLLLEEVKRWHKVRDYILEKSSHPTVKKLHLKDLLNFMEEVIE